MNNGYAQGTPHQDQNLGNDSPGPGDTADYSTLTSEDENVIEQKAKAGELVSGHAVISGAYIELDSADFPELKQDQPDDEVVVVLKGKVQKVDDDGSVLIEFTCASVVHGKMPPLGSGQRFQNLENTLSNQKGINDPAALAAVIGRRRYGSAKMANWAAKGRKG